MSTFRAHTFNLSTQFPNAVLGLELRIISHCVGWPQECLFLPFWNSSSRKKRNLWTLVCIHFCNILSISYDLRQMDPKQLPNYWKHPSRILDIRKTHSGWRNTGEWNCNSCRLQRSELIKSISLWPFYSQKGDWHPPGMAPTCHVAFCGCFGFLKGPVHLLQVSCDWTNPTSHPAMGNSLQPCLLLLSSGTLVISGEGTCSVWVRSALGQGSKTKLRNLYSAMMLELFLPKWSSVGLFFGQRPHISSAFQNPNFWELSITVIVTFQSL